MTEQEKILQKLAEDSYQLGWLAAMDSIKPTIEKLDQTLHNAEASLIAIDKSLAAMGETLKPLPTLIPYKTIRKWWPW